MDFNKITDIKLNDFSGFLSIKELKESSIRLPCERGIYFVLLNKNKKPALLSKGSGGYFKKKDPNVKLEELNLNWIDNTKVLYIGQAGGMRKDKWSNSTLCKRITDYIAFGSGENVAHYGGRYIWQIKDNHNLIICWKTLPNKTKDPSKVEREYLQEFKNKYKRLPFANLKLG